MNIFDLFFLNKKMIDYKDFVHKYFPATHYTKKQSSHYNNVRFVDLHAPYKISKILIYFLQCRIPELSMMMKTDGKDRFFSKVIVK